MGKYTVYGQKVDAAIEKDLSIIKDILIKEVNPISITLFGGFGKGEGSVEIVNGNVIPFNDYDLYLITRSKLSNDRIEDLVRRTSRAIGRGGLDFVEHPGENYDSKRFFHVDVRDIPLSDLPRLKRTQRTIELKYASQVIWGDESVLARIPPVSSDGLSVSEGVRNLFNKMNTLLLCMDFEKLRGVELAPDERKIIIYYAVKAYLSCSVALLILRGKFQPTYTGRTVLLEQIFQDEFPSLAQREPDLVRKIRWARDFKVKLDFDGIDDLVALWFQARDDIGKVFRYVIQTYLDLDENDWRSISRAMYNKLPIYYFRSYLSDILSDYHLPRSLAKVLFPSQYYLNVLYWAELRQKGLSSHLPLLDWRDAGLKVAIPLILLLQAIKEKGEVDSELLADSKYYFSKIVPKKRIANEISEYRRQVLEFYGAYYMQKLL